MWSLETEPPVSLIVGLPFHHTTMDEALRDYTSIMRGNSSAYWITANVDFATRAPTDPILKDLVFHADRVFCDGLPLVWLSKLFGRSLPERVAGSDLVPKLLETSAREGHRVYFLGSDEKTLSKASQIATERYPDLQIAGHHSPPFAHVHEWDNEHIIANIRATKADLVLVAVGSPKQERWISGYFDRTGAKLAIGIGASLDFIAGSQTRAPRWVQRVGFEWLWRMLSNPKRLAKRYASNFLYLGAAAFTQWRAYKKSFPVEQQSERQPIDGVIDLTSMNKLTPAALAGCVTEIRQARRADSPPPSVLASKEVSQELKKLGLMPPLNSAERQEDTPSIELLKAANGCQVKAPRSWRSDIWDPALESGVPVQIDLKQTSFIDYPTLLRLNELKLKLEKQQLSLKMVSVMPELEGLMGALGFSELLDGSRA